MRWLLAIEAVAGPAVALYHAIGFSMTLTGAVTVLTRAPFSVLVLLNECLLKEAAVLCEVFVG